MSFPNSRIPDSCIPKLSYPLFDSFTHISLGVNDPYLVAGMESYRHEYWIGIRFPL